MIDWTKPLELMDGTPVRLCDAVKLDGAFGGTNPDNGGHYWVEREDGGTIDSFHLKCVADDSDDIRNRVETTAPADDEIPQHIYQRVGEVEMFKSGATLRDRFAMAALTGLLARDGYHPADPASVAYRHADAMMEARK